MKDISTFAKCWPPCEGRGKCIMMGAFGPQRLIRVRLVVVNLNPINDTYMDYGTSWLRPSYWFQRPTNERLKQMKVAEGSWCSFRIWGGLSLCCLHFGISQLMEIEECFGIFVRVLLGWLSNRSLYQKFPVNPSLLYQAVGTQASVAKIPFKLKGQIEKVFRRLLASPRLVQKGRIYWKFLVQP